MFCNYAYIALKTVYRTVIVIILAEVLMHGVYFSHGSNINFAIFSESKKKKNTVVIERSDNVPSLDFIN